MAEILHQLRLVVYPIIYKDLYIPGGARFQPSTVVVNLVPGIFQKLFVLKLEGQSLLQRHGEKHAGISQPTMFSFQIQVFSFPRLLLQFHQLKTPKNSHTCLKNCALRSVFQLEAIAQLSKNILPTLFFSVRKSEIFVQKICLLKVQK